MPNVNFTGGTDIGEILKKDPRSWFNARYVGFGIASNERASMADAIYDPSGLLTAGPIANSLKFPTGYVFDAVYSSKHGADAVTMRSSLARRDIGIRALPWMADHITYTQMDENARFFATGPLQGCHIYVAGSRRTPWVFHANNNAGGGDVNANMASKLKMTLDLMSTGLGPQIVSGGLKRNEYSTIGLAGFVFGVRQNKAWRFWSYLFNPHLKHWRVQDMPCALTG